MNCNVEWIWQRLFHLIYGNVTCSMRCAWWIHEWCVICMQHVVERLKKFLSHLDNFFLFSPCFTNFTGQLKISSYGTSFYSFFKHTTMIPLENGFLKFAPLLISLSLLSSPIQSQYIVVMVHHIHFMSRWNRVKIWASRWTRLTNMYKWHSNCFLF